MALKCLKGDTITHTKRKFMIMTKRNKKMVFAILSLLIIGLLLNLVMLNEHYRVSSIFSVNEISNNYQSIIFPSRGCPLEIENGVNKNKRFSIYIVLPGNLISDKITGNLKSTLPDGKDFIVPLNEMSLSKVKSSTISTPGGFSDWIKNTFDEIYEVKCTMDSFSNNTVMSNVLFDLSIKINSIELMKKGCLFVSNNDNDKKVIVATDIHISKRWDNIEKEMAKYLLPDNPDELLPLDTIEYSKLISFNTFLNSYSNPNSNFISLIKKANKLHREGNLDFIVLTGDLVDFKYNEPREKSKQRYEDSDWFVFSSILDGIYPNSERLEVPIYTLTGNHDYRLYPYRIQVYGIKHCGIPEDLTKAYLKKSNQYSMFKYELADADAIRVNDGRNHSLDYYYLHFNPFNDYYIDYARNRFIFLDTKSDAFCHFNNVASKGFKKLSELEHPPSGGFDEQQIDFFNKVADTTKNIFVFCHAPVLSTSNYYTGNEKDMDVELPLVKFPEKPNMEGISIYEDNLFKSNLTFATVFKGQYHIIKKLHENPNSTMLFTGHCHRIDQYKLSKNTDQLFRCRYIADSAIYSLPKDNILFFLTPSLGHLPMSADEIEEPMFRTLVFQNGEVSSVIQNFVNERPFDKVKSFVLFKKQESSTDIELRVEEDKILQKKHIHRFIVFYENNDPKFDAQRVQSSISKNDYLLKEFSDGENKHFWLYQVNNNFLKLNIKNIPSDGKYYFAIESFLKTDNSVKSLGIRRFSIPLE